MKKAITKSILCLILALSIALPSFYLAVENVLRVYGITNAYCYWRESDYYIGNFSGITLSKKDFNKKYHAIKSELSKNPDFIDLIPQICADQLIDCGGEKAKIEYSAYSPYPGYEMQSAQITNQKAYYDGKTEVYYDALKECEYIEIVEGRAIDTSKNYKQGDIMEIMTDESCPFPSTQSFT